MKKQIGMLMAAAMLISSAAVVQAEEAEPKGTLTLAYWETDTPEWWAKVQEDTGIEVVYEQIDSKEYANIMSTRVKGGEAPDIYFTRNENLAGMYAENGYAAALTDFEDIINENVSETVVDFCHSLFGDTIYGIPVTLIYGNVLFYNADLFAEHGIEVPTNMDEFVAVCDQFTELGVTPFINGSAETNHIKHISFCPSAIVNANDNEAWMRGLEDGTSSFTDETWVKATQYFQDGLKYSDPASIGLTHVEAWAQFAEGATAMFTGMSYMLPQNYTEFTPEFEMGLAALPYNYEGEAHLTLVAANNIMVVNEQSENKDLALEYYEYWLTHLQEYSELTQIPSPAKAMEGEESTQWASYSQYFDYLSTLPAYTGVEVTAIVENDFFSFIQGMITGELTVDDLGDLQDKLEVALG